MTTDQTLTNHPFISPRHDSRLQQIEQWLKDDLGMGKSGFEIQVASADASFRRYFRLLADGQSWIIMDAPPQQEDCHSFVYAARLLEQAGVHAPHIFHFNEAQGFMLLSDLGSTAYLDQLNEQTVDGLYADAIAALVKMQSIQAELPPYDRRLLDTEMNLFGDWYLQTHRGIELSAAQSALIDDTFALLAHNALQQQVVFVHRDYHSRNLMRIDDNNPGVIDFQDAVNGPASYDLVSLIKDCYIAWPRHKLLQWVDAYLDASPLDLHRDTFVKQLDLMGMQRHLKAIGIFARLNHRDNKPGYLNDIPRTLAYVQDVCERYAELADFAQLLSELGVEGDSETRTLIR